MDTSLYQDFKNFFNEPRLARSLVILVLSVCVAYLISRLLARLIIKAAQFVAVHADSANNAERTVQLRRVETYLSVATAVIRTVTVIVVAYIGWSVFSPLSNFKVAAIGVGTIFVVIAGSTISPLLRDITAGSTMIIERWFNVGDFIRIEPFSNLGGVVERVTLRSTKLRSLNGEVIWVHNQHIQGVRTTPRGLRTLLVDVFVRDADKGKELVERVISTIPSGPMTVVNLEIEKEEQWSKTLWLLTVQGQTPPGREWLIESYFIESLKELEDDNKQKVLARKPIVRFADPAAERSFKRAVRAQ